MESWNQCPSTKLVALIQLCRHHLARDGVAPLKIDPNRADENAFIVTPDYPPEHRLAEDSPDKIVIYTAFPSQNPSVMAVSIAHDNDRTFLTPWI